MTKISLFTPINYAIPCSCAQGALSILSNYFYLGGTRATVVKGNEVRLENGKVSKSTIALKVASYVLLFPLTLTLLAIDLALRSRYHFTVITPSKKSSQAPVPVTPERESTHPSSVTITAQPIERVRQEIIPTPQKETSFHPFTIQIATKNLLLSSKEEMRLKVQEIGQKVLDEHIKLRIDIPFHDDLQEKTQAMEFLEQLKSFVDVITVWRSDNEFYIVPKKTEEIIQENLTIRKYKNGIIEVVQSSREIEVGSWVGSTIYPPNGVIKTGVFLSFLRTAYSGDT